MDYDMVITDGLVVFDDAAIHTDIAVSNGKFVAFGEGLHGQRTIDATGLIVVPGKVDPHVHINAPGGGVRDDWEGFVTATSAAAKGGITTMLQMPCNQIPATTNAQSFERVLQEARGKLKVDVGQTGGLEPQNLTGGIAEQNKMGVVNYKAFLGTTGDKDLQVDLYNCDDYSLYEGMRQIAQTGKILIMHCENAAITDRLGKVAHQHGARKLSEFVATRPVFTEVEAIERACLLAKETGCRIHIVHVSSPEGAEAVDRARKAGVDVSCETCNHYLYFDTSELDSIGNIAKCTPPIRSKENQHGLWRKVFDGTIDFIVSDHSPAPLSLKETDDAFTAWGGIGSVQNDVDVFFDEAVQKRGMSLTQFVALHSSNAAQRYNLQGKGSIRLGFDADLAFIKPDAPYTLRAQDLEYRNKFSPYVGRTIGCQVVRTLLRGMEVYSKEHGVTREYAGRFILHPES